MTLGNLLTADQIIPEMKATERWSAIVELVEWGTTPAEILAQYPDLEADDIPEALRFAAEVVRRRGLAKP